MAIDQEFSFTSTDRYSEVKEGGDLLSPPLPHFSSFSKDPQKLIEEESDTVMRVMPVPLLSCLVKFLSLLSSVSLFLLYFNSSKFIKWTPLDQVSLSDVGLLHRPL